LDNIASTDIEGVNLMLGGAEVDAYPSEQELILNIIIDKLMVKNQNMSRKGAKTQSFHKKGS
jgi:hypothetical protein